MENLFLIVGLGNPGREYAQTRHNAGFMVLGRLAAQHRASWNSEARFQARLARMEWQGKVVLLAEPQTFMNASGTAVQGLMAYYKAGLDRLLVVVDDADLPLGEIRLRGSGSSGGHHGLESIEQHLGSREYARLRVGIGRRADGVREITEHVLGRFGAEEKPLLDAVLQKVCEQVECWLSAGLKKAMNDFNGAITAPLLKES